MKPSTPLGPILISGLKKRASTAKQQYVLASPVIELSFLNFKIISGTFSIYNKSSEKFGINYFLMSFKKFSVGRDGM